MTQNTYGQFTCWRSLWYAERLAGVSAHGRLARVITCEGVSNVLKSLLAEGQYSTSLFVQACSKALQVYASPTVLRSIPYSEAGCIGFVAD